MSEVKLPDTRWQTEIMTQEYDFEMVPAYTADQMEEYAEQRVREALKYVSDGARMYDLGTPDGHAIADFIDSYAEAQKLNK